MKKKKMKKSQHSEVTDEMTRRKSFGEVKDLLGDLLDGGIEVKVGGRTLDLDVRLTDTHSFLAMSSQEQNEETIQQMTNTLQQILYRSYLPHWDEEKDQEKQGLSDDQKQENKQVKQMIERLMVKNLTDLFTQISVALGWATEEEIEEQAKQLGEGQQGKNFQNQSSDSS